MGTFRVTSSSDATEFVAKGASLSDLFETAAAALFSLVYDRSTVGFERELTVSGETADLESLLAAWLGELWRLYREESFVLGDFIVVEVGAPPSQRYGPPLMTLRAAVRGRPKGDWFQPFQAGLHLVTCEVLQLRDHKRSFEATVRVITANAS